MLDGGYPLTEPVDGEAYMRVLVQRMEAWTAAQPVRPFKLRYPPLIEWFAYPEDEQWVKLPKSEPAPKSERKPRQYRSAESLREERDEIQAKMDVITGDDGYDPAVVNLSPFSRSKSAARAGRKRFAKMDRDLERYTALQRRLDNLNGRIASAEARERRAG